MLIHNWRLGQVTKQVSQFRDFYSLLTQHERQLSSSDWLI